MKQPKVGEIWETIEDDERDEEYAKVIVTVVTGDLLDYKFWQDNEGTKSYKNMMGDMVAVDTFMKWYKYSRRLSSPLGKVINGYN